MKKFQISALFQIIILSVFIIFIIDAIIIYKYSYISVTETEHLAIVSIIVLISWWIIYFISPITGLPTLRMYLRHNSDIRGENAGEMNNYGAVLYKSRSSTTTIAIFTAVMSVFLSIVLNSEDSQLTDYQAFIKPIIVFLAFSTMLLFMFAIDLFDTVSNKFVKTDADNDNEVELSEKIDRTNKLIIEVQEIDESEKRAEIEGAKKYDTEKKLAFYRKVGNLWPKGAISYAYFGYSLFTIILILTLSFFYQNLTSLFLVFFVYLGYPIFYDYKLINYKEKERIVTIYDKQSNLHRIIPPILIFFLLLLYYYLHCYIKSM